MTMTSPQSVDAQLRAPRSALDAGDLARAESAARAVLQQDPSHGSALHLLGRIAMSSGRGPEAVDLLRRAVAAAPDLAAAHADLGRLLAGANQLGAGAGAVSARGGVGPRT